ncbi:MAG: peptide chain release factor N(5)-glutamine methyltransferase [Pseudomonadota bacterium]
MASTIDQIIRQAAEQFAASSPSPRLDAEVLLMHVTGLARTALITRAQELLLPEKEERLHELLARRALGEPVAYLTGRREFWSLDLNVTPDVLIPRPETELLVEQALALIPEDSDWTVADLGTGSGAIALAIATERPHCRLIATDLSTAALAVARGNATRLGIATVKFRHGEWLKPLAGTRLDVIVSNPPYVCANDPHLTLGDVRFEPESALVAGADGLDAIRCIAADAVSYLRPGGWLLFEHGYDQALAVRMLLETNGYDRVVSCRDIGGHERITAGRSHT